MALENAIENRRNVGHSSDCHYGRCLIMSVVLMPVK